MLEIKTAKKRKLRIFIIKTARIAHDFQWFLPLCDTPVQMLETSFPGMYCLLWAIPPRWFAPSCLRSSRSPHCAAVEPSIPITLFFISAPAVQMAQPNICNLVPWYRNWKGLLLWRRLPFSTRFKMDASKPSKQISNLNLYSRKFICRREVNCMLFKQFAPYSVANKTNPENEWSGVLRRQPARPLQVIFRTTLKHLFGLAGFQRATRSFGWAPIVCNFVIKSMRWGCFQVYETRIQS